MRKGNNEYRFYPDMLIWVILTLLFLERMLVFAELGPEYNSGSESPGLP